MRSPSSTFLALCWSQPQEPGSVLPGCPWASALTPLSLQGEVGSPGQPGLPGLKVGAPGDWHGLCASTWVCGVLGRTPVLPSLGLSGGCSTLHLALSRTLLQGDAGVPGVDGRPGLEGFPGPQVGASAPPPFQKPPHSRQGTLGRCRPTCSSFIPSSQNSPLPVPSAVPLLWDGAHLMPAVPTLLGSPSPSACHPARHRLRPKASQPGSLPGPCRQRGVA